MTEQVDNHPDSQELPPEARTTGFGISREFIKVIQEALETHDADRIREIVNPLHPADVADVIEGLTPTNRKLFVEIMRKDLHGEILAEIEDTVREQVLEQLSTEELAAAITDLESDDAAFILDDLDDEHQRKILQVIPVEDRLPLEQSLSYADDTAGRLMQREVVTAPITSTLGQIIDTLGKYTDLPESFYEIFILDESGVPKGSIALSKILRYPRKTPVVDVMEREIVIVPVTMLQEDVSYLFKHYSLYSAPVTESDGKIVGMITIDDVVELIDEEAGSEILKMGGVSEETYHGTIYEMCVSRFRWLLVTFFTTLIATTVISHFKPVLEEIVIIAVLLPIVATLGGSVGMQVVTVTVRALYTHHMREGQVLGILKRELYVAMILGAILSIVLLGIVVAWFGDWKIGIIISFSLITNILWAGIAGTLGPYILHKLNMDPAISAGPLITTTTDVIGFALFLGLATFFLL